MSKRASKQAGRQASALLMAIPLLLMQILLLMTPMLMLLLLHFPCISLAFWGIFASDGNEESMSIHGQQRSIDETYRESAENQHTSTSRHHPPATSGTSHQRLATNHQPQATSHQPSLQPPTTNIKFDVHLLFLSHRRPTRSSSNDLSLQLQLFIRDGFHCIRCWLRRALDP